MRREDHVKTQRDGRLQAKGTHLRINQLLTVGLTLLASRTLRKYISLVEAVHSVVQGKAALANDTAGLREL